MTESQEMLSICNHTPIRLLRLRLAFLAMSMVVGVVLLSLTACEDPSRRLSSQDLHIPSGWELASGTQMLARSYPYAGWITLITRLQSKPRKLFVAPYKTPPLPGGGFSLFGRRRQNPAPAPGMPGQAPPPRRKTKKIYGFSFVVRANRDARLELRLPVRGRDFEELVYVHPMTIQRTGSRWKTLHFFYRDFRPVNPKTTRARMNPYYVSRTEFWERPHVSNPPSLTLTIKGPFLYKSTAKPKRNPTSHPTRPSTRASSPPTTRAASRPTTRTTSRPSRPRLRSRSPASRPSATR